MKYIIYIILALFSLTPVVWFWGRKDTLITGVDTNFPLDPLVWFMRRFYVWNDVANAGSDFSASVAGMFFHLIQTIPYQLGFGLQQVELFSLIFWFLLIVSSAFLFSRTVFEGKSLVQLLFVSLYAFNVYLFNTWENVKVANLALVAAIPLGLTIFHQLREGKIRNTQVVFYSALTGIVLSGTGINPAYFLVFFITLTFFALGGVLSDLNKKNVVKEISSLVLISAVVLLVNLFWILPSANFISKNIAASNSITGIGFRNWIDSISVNTSFLNVLRLQGAWDWYAFDPETKLPYYIPYAPNYFHKLPFLLFSFLMPLLAIISFFFSERKRNGTYLAFGMMLIAGVFLGAGTHSPSGVVYQWLSDNIPFFSLFRSPWYIFTPLVTLSLAGLISLFFASFSERTPALKVLRFNLSKTLFGLVIIFLIGANLVYSYPLVLGKIFRPDRSDGFMVQFPDYVFDAKKGLSLKDEGRMISYPGDESENFRWGYRGIESISALMFNQEIIFSPFNAPNSSIGKMIKEFYQSIDKMQINAAENIAAKLNVSSVFYKEDQKSFASPLPDSIRRQNLQEFGKWSFYRFPKDREAAKVFTATDTYFAYPYDLAEQSVSILKPSDLVLKPNDSIVKQASALALGSGGVVLAENSQIGDMKDFEDPELSATKRIFAGDLSRVEFDFDLPVSGSYRPFLEKYKIEHFGIDLAKPLEVEVDGQKTFLVVEKADDSYVVFNALNLAAGTHKISFGLTPRNLVEGGDFNGAVAFKKNNEGAGYGQFDILDSGDVNRGKFLSLLNLGDKDLGVSFKVQDFDPFSDYYIETKHKQVYGNVGRILVLQPKGNLNAKIQSESLPNYPEWRTFHSYYQPSRMDSQMVIKLEAPHIGDPLGTKVYFDDLKIYRVFSNRMMLVRSPENQGLAASKIEYKKSSPVLYEGVVKGGLKPQVVIFSENFSPEWEFTAFDINGKELNLKPKHFSANLYANAWYIQEAPGEYKFKIYYKPQDLFLRGFAVSSIVLVVATFLYIRPLISRRKKIDD